MTPTHTRKHLLLLSDKLLECIATTCSRRNIDQCIQEQTGQTLDGYGRMKVSTNRPVNNKYKYKYKYLYMFNFIHHT